MQSWLGNGRWRPRSAARQDKKPWPIVWALGGMLLLALAITAAVLVLGLHCLHYRGFQREPLKASGCIACSRGRSRSRRGSSPSHRLLTPAVRYRRAVPPRRRQVPGTRLPQGQEAPPAQAQPPHRRQARRAPRAGHLEPGALFFTACQPAAPPPKLRASRTLASSAGLLRTRPAAATSTARSAVTTLAGAGASIAKRFRDLPGRPPRRRQDSRRTPRTIDTDGHILRRWFRDQVRLPALDAADLGIRVRVYDLRPSRVRLDTTTASG